MTHRMEDAYSLLCISTVTQATYVLLSIRESNAQWKYAESTLLRIGELKGGLLWSSHLAQVKQ